MEQIACSEVGGELLAGRSGIPDNWREARWLFLILVFALLVRLVYLPSLSVIETDGVHYVAIAESLARGHGFQSSIYPPGYPLAIATALTLGAPDGETAGRAASLVSGIIVIVLLVIVGRQLYGPKAGLAAGFLGAIYPPFIRKATEVMSEATYMAAWLGAVGALLAGLRTGRLGHLGMAGLLAGFSYLTRPEGAALVICLLIVIGWEGKRLAWPRLRLLASILLFTVGTSLLAVPYAAYLRVETGSWSLSGKTLLALKWAEANEESPEALETLLFSLTPDDEIQVPTATHQTETYLHDNFGPIVKRYVRNLYVEYWLLSKSLFSFLLIALIGVGFIAPPWDEPRLRREAFCLALLLPLLVLPVFPVVDRFLIPSALVFLLWGGRGIQQVEQWVVGDAPSVWQWLMRGTLLVGLIATTALPLVARPHLVSFDESPTEWQEVGKWINTHLPPDTVLLTRRPQISYYARRQALPIPYANLDAIIRYARKHGVSVLVMDERFTIHRRPQLQPLLSAPLPAEFELLHVEGSIHGRRVFVFKFK